MNEIRYGRRRKFKVKESPEEKTEGEQMPLGPVNPEGKNALGFCQQGRHRGLTRGPSTLLPPPSPASSGRQVLETAFQSAPRRRLFWDTAACRPARLDAQHWSAAHPRPVGRGPLPIQGSSSCLGRPPLHPLRATGLAVSSEEGTGHPSQTKASGASPSSLPPPPPSFEQETPGSIVLAPVSCSK